MAQTVPDTLFAPIIQFIGTAFLPLYSRQESEGLEAGNAYVNKSYNFLLLFSSFMVVFCVVFSRQLVALFAPGFENSTVNLTSFYLRLSCFLLLGNAGITVFEPFLRYKGSYIAPALFGLAQSFVLILFTAISLVTCKDYIIIGVVIGYTIRGFGLHVIVEYDRKEYDIVFSVVEARRSPYFYMVEKKGR